MRSVRLIVTALAVCAYPLQPVFAEMEHRMGGLPGMPAHVLKPGGSSNITSNSTPAPPGRAPR
jgi:hypothetical protein